MKNIILTLTLLISINIDAFTQVGIGNATPNAKSILDLTNSTNGKALILPKPIAPISLVGNFDTEAMMFYYLDKIYVRTSTGLNVLSPWLFDGTNTNGIYVASGTPVGIGIAPLTNSTAILTIADAGDVRINFSTASVVIGDNDFDAPHMLIDKDELLVKTNANTAGTLKLQEDGGDVVIRGALDAGLTTILTAHGSVDAKGKIKENGNDLLPVGSIIMWNGTTVPAGWALCDGGTYTLDAGGTIATPDLRERFIVGAGGANTTSTVNGSTGGYPIGVGTNSGENSHTLTVSEMPSHSHATTQDPHSHKYSSTWGYVGPIGTFEDKYENPDSGNFQNRWNNSSEETISITVNNNGGGQAHENRPPYFALAFIMKL